MGRVKAKQESGCRAWDAFSYYEQIVNKNISTNPKLTGKVCYIILYIEGNRLPNRLQINNTRRKNT